MFSVGTLRRVLQIRRQKKTATAFTIDHKDCQYLVTAKHFVNDVSGCEIEIFNGVEFAPESLEIVGLSSDESNVAILAAKRELTVNLPMPAARKNIKIGETLHFLGFPSAYPEFAKQNGALPFVKSGMASAIDVAGRLILDGQSDEGFFGGPIILSSGDRLGNPSSVVGINSGKPFGEQPLPLAETPQLGERGLIFSTPIGEAIKLIESNPIGYEL